MGSDSRLRGEKLAEGSGTSETSPRRTPLPRQRLLDPPGPQSFSRHSNDGECERRAKQSSKSFFASCFFGRRSARSQFNAPARQTISKSEIQRTWVSIFANVSLLRFQPHRLHRAASWGWVSPAWYRSLRTAGPAMLRGLDTDCSEFGT